MRIAAAPAILAKRNTPFYANDISALQRGAGARGRGGAGARGRGGAGARGRGCDTGRDIEI
jgi:hypothetical protein